MSISPVPDVKLHIFITQNLFPFSDVIFFTVQYIFVNSDFQ